MSIGNPANYLDLCQRACVECGVAPNVAVATALPTVTGATGSLGRVVNWVGDAWSDLQMEHDDWQWMRSTQIFGQGISFPTIAGQFHYPLGTGAGTVGVEVADFGKWVEEDPDGSGSSFWNYTTAGGVAHDEIQMPVIPFGYWRNTYMQGANRDVRSRPLVVAVGPDQSVNLGPNVTADYTVTGDFFVAPSNMEVDADIPVGLPARFWMLIVYGCMKKYGGYESAPEVYTRGVEEYADMYAQLTAVRAPKISWSGALV